MLALQPGADAVRNRSFEITGFFCDDAVCETAPRPLSAELRFRSDQAPLLDAMPRLSRDWSATLNCEVRRDRLRRCRAMDGSEPSAPERTIALRLARTIRRDEPGGYPRAIVFVAFERGECPSWFCVPTPPPPPGPDTAALARGGRHR